MATKKNFIYLGGGGERVNPIIPDHFEFEESDIWNLSGVVCNEPKRSLFGSGAPKKIIKRNDHHQGHGRAVVAATSLPVKVPDWSKILRGEYSKNRRIENDDDDDDDEEEDRIPPHEYLARTRIANSFSVHEGIGRTLKGRDLRRVRNAIWKQTGFED